MFVSLIAVVLLNMVLVCIVAWEMRLIPVVQFVKRLFWMFAAPPTYELPIP